MPTSLGQSVHREEQSRTWEDTVFNRLFQSVCGSPTIAHARKATREHLLTDIWLSKGGHSKRVTEGLAKFLEPRDSHKVNVGVDKPWTEKTTFEIDDDRILRVRRIYERSFDDFVDEARTNYNCAVCSNDTRFSVNDVRVLKNVDCLRWEPPRLDRNGYNSSTGSQLVR
jgi:hypothetical protein